MTAASPGGVPILAERTCTRTLSRWMGFFEASTQVRPSGERGLVESGLPLPGPSAVASGCLAGCWPSFFPLALADPFVSSAEVSFAAFLELNTTTPAIPRPTAITDRMATASRLLRCRLLGLATVRPSALWVADSVTGLTTSGPGGTADAAGRAGAGLGAAGGTLPGSRAAGGSSIGRATGNDLALRGAAGRAPRLPEYFAGPRRAVSATGLAVASGRLSEEPSADNSPLTQTAGIHGPSSP